MKILCSADWHLDAPMAAGDESLRASLLEVPGKIARLCRQEQCDLVLLSGDLFDGPYTPAGLSALRQALQEMAVPVFIAPGNHDCCGPDSPWEQTVFPENVHIFTSPRLEGVYVPSLELTVYGAGYRVMDCPALLEGFRAEGNAVCVLHGDPTAPGSPYCPVSRSQVERSGLSLVALGHIHKAGHFTAGDSLCLWPGCPMGRGFDETGEKGVYIAELSPAPSCRFVALDTPRFYDLTLPVEALERTLSAAGDSHYYRITLTGESEGVDTQVLERQYSRFPNLQLRDRTVPPLDIWGSAGEDTFEGVYFGLLRQALENAPEEEKKTVLLAAQLSRRLLEDREVSLP